MGNQQADLQFQATLDDQVSPKADQIEKKLKELGATPSEIKMYLKAYDQASSQAQQVQQQMARIPKEQVVQITARHQDALRNIDQVRSAAAKPVDVPIRFSDNLREHMQGMTSTLQAFSNKLLYAGQTGLSMFAGPMLGAVGGIGAGLSGGAALYTGMQVNKNLEQQMVSLQQMLKNKTAAQTEMQNLTAFTQKTPFQLGQVVSADVMIRNLGLEPGSLTKGPLSQASNLASTFGTDVSSAAQAVGLAQLGDFRRLRQYGMPVTQSDFQFGGRFQGQSYQQALDVLMRPYQGAMQMQQHTVPGMLSNIKDITEQNVLGKGTAPLYMGAGSVIQSVQNKLQSPETLKEIGKAVQQVQLAFAKLFDDVKKGAQYFEVNLQKPLEQLITTVAKLGSAFGKAVGKDTVGIIKYAAQAFVSIGNAVAGAVKELNGLVSIFSPFGNLMQTLAMFKVLNSIGVGKGITKPFSDLATSLNPLSFSLKGIVSSLVHIAGIAPKVFVVLSVKNFMDLQQATSNLNSEFKNLGKNGSSGLDMLNAKLDVMAFKLGKSAASVKNMVADYGRMVPHNVPIAQQSAFAQEATKNTINLQNSGYGNVQELYKFIIGTRGKYTSKSADSGADDLSRASQAVSQSLGISLKKATDAATLSITVFGSDLAKLHQYNLGGMVSATQMFAGLNRVGVNAQQAKTGQNPLSVMHTLFSRYAAPSIEDVNNAGLGSWNLHKFAGGGADVGQLNSANAVNANQRRSYSQLQSDINRMLTITLPGRGTSHIEPTGGSVLPTPPDLYKQNKLNVNTSQLNPQQIASQWNNINKAINDYEKNLEKAQQAIQQLSNKQSELQYAQDGVNEAVAEFNNKLALKFGNQIQDMTVAIQGFSLKALYPLQRALEAVQNQMAIYQQRAVVPIQRAQEDWNNVMTKTSYAIDDISYRMNRAQYNLNIYSSGLLKGEQAALDNIHALDLYSQKLQLIRDENMGMQADLSRSVVEQGFQYTVKPMMGFSLAMQQEIVNRKKEIAQLQYDTGPGEGHYQMTKAERTQWQRKEMSLSDRLGGIKRSIDVIDKSTLSQHNMEAIQHAQEVHARSLEQAMYHASVGARGYQDQQFALGQQMYSVNRQIEAQQHSVDILQNKYDQAALKLQAFNQAQFNLTKAGFQLGQQQYVQQQNADWFQNNLTQMRVSAQSLYDLMQKSISPRDFKKMIQFGLSAGILDQQQATAMENSLVDYHKKTAHRVQSIWTTATNFIKSSILGLFTGKDTLMAADFFKHIVDGLSKSLLNLNPGALSTVGGLGVGMYGTAVGLRTLGIGRGRLMNQLTHAVVGGTVGRLPVFSAIEDFRYNTSKQLRPWRTSPALRAQQSADRWATARDKWVERFGQSAEYDKSYMKNAEEFMTARASMYEEMAKTASNKTFWYPLHPFMTWRGDFAKFATFLSMAKMGAPLPVAGLGGAVAERAGELVPGSAIKWINTEVKPPMENFGRWMYSDKGFGTAFQLLAKDMSEGRGIFGLLMKGIVAFSGLLQVITGHLTSGLESLAGVMRQFTVGAKILDGVGGVASASAAAARDATAALGDTQAAQKAINAIRITGISSLDEAQKILNTARISGDWGLARATAPARLANRALHGVGRFIEHPMTWPAHLVTDTVKSRLGITTDLSAIGEQVSQVDKIGEIFTKAGNILDKLPLLALAIKGFRAKTGGVGSVLGEIEAGGRDLSVFEKAVARTGALFGRILEPFSKLLKFAGKIGWWLQGGMDVLNIATGNKGQRKSGEFDLAGMGIGAALGSPGGPVGIMVGATIGGILGDLAAKIDWGKFMKPIGKGISNVANFLGNLGKHFIDIINPAHWARNAYWVGEKLGEMVKFLFFTLPVDYFTKFLPLVTKAVANFFGTLGLAIIKWLLSLPATIINVLLSWPGKVNNAVVAAFDAITGFFTEGISNMISDVGGAISGAFNWVVDELRKIPLLGALIPGGSGGGGGGGGPGIISTALGVGKTIVNTPVNLVKGFIHGLAGGTDRVAKDGTLAVLHQDEAVLQAAEAHRYRQTKGAANYEGDVAEHIAAILKTAHERVLTGGGIGLGLSKYPGLAAGGTVIGAGGTIVGENGAELLNLPTGATVTPLQNMDQKIFSIQRSFHTDLAASTADANNKQDKIDKQHYKNASSNADKGMSDVHKNVKDWSHKSNKTLGSVSKKADHVASHLNDLKIKIPPIKMPKIDMPKMPSIPGTPGAGGATSISDQIKAYISQGTQTATQKGDFLHTLHGMSTAHIEQLQTNLQTAGIRQGQFDPNTMTFSDPAMQAINTTLANVAGNRLKAQMAADKKTQDEQNSHQDLMGKIVAAFTSADNNTFTQYVSHRETNFKQHHDNLRQIGQTGYATQQQDTTDFWNKLTLNTGQYGNNVIDQIKAFTKHLTKAVTNYQNGPASSSSTPGIGVDAGGGNPRHAHGGLVDGKRIGHGHKVVVGEEGFPEMIIPLAPHRRDRALRLINETIGHMGGHGNVHKFAAGGLAHHKHHSAKHPFFDMSDDAHIQSSFQRIWNVAQPFYPGSSTMPQMRPDPGNMNVPKSSLTDVNGARDQKLSYVDVTGTMLKSMQAGEPWGLQMAIHEWAHQYQNQSMQYNRQLSEGGAQYFADLVAPQVFNKLHVPYKNPGDFNYTGYVNYVKKNLGPHWAMVDQFNQSAKYAAGGYVNPFPQGAGKSRIDMGTDYYGSGQPIDAIGDATVTSIGPGSGGWEPSYVSYQLKNGRYAGQYVYVAEQFIPAALKKGQEIRAGQKVGNFAGAIEIGFSQSGALAAPSMGALSGGDTVNSAAGVAMSNLIASLGGPSGNPQAGGVVGKFLGANYVLGKPSSGGFSTGAPGGGPAPLDLKIPKHLADKLKHLGPIGQFINHNLHKIIATAASPKGGTGPGLQRSPGSYHGALDHTFGSNDGKTISMAQAVSLAQKAGFPANVAQLFGHVAFAESSLQPGQVNSIGATGLWQIYSHPDLVKKYGDMRDPWHNAEAAYSLWKQSGMSPWVYSQNAGDGGGWGKYASHMGGIDRVPHDGYAAILHKDERVQPAATAHAARTSEHSRPHLDRLAHDVHGIYTTFLTHGALGKGGHQSLAKAIHQAQIEHPLQPGQFHSMPGGQTIAALAFKAGSPIGNAYSGRAGGLATPYTLAGQYQNAGQQNESGFYETDKSRVAKLFENYASHHKKNQLAQAISMQLKSEGGDTDQLVKSALEDLNRGKANKHEKPSDMKELRARYNEAKKLEKEAQSLYKGDAHARGISDAIIGRAIGQATNPELNINSDAELSPWGQVKRRGKIKLGGGTASPGDTSYYTGGLGGPAVDATGNIIHSPVDTHKHRVAQHKQAKAAHAAASGHRPEHTGQAHELSHHATSATAVAASVRSALGDSHDSMRRHNVAAMTHGDADVFASVRGQKTVQEMPVKDNKTHSGLGSVVAAVKKIKMPKIGPIQATDKAVVAAIQQANQDIKNINKALSQNAVDMKINNKYLNQNNVDLKIVSNLIKQNNVDTKLVAAAINQNSKDLKTMSSDAKQAWSNLDKINTGIKQSDIDLKLIHAAHVASTQDLKTLQGLLKDGNLSAKDRAAVLKAIKATQAAVQAENRAHHLEARAHYLLFKAHHETQKALYEIAKANKDLHRARNELLKAANELKKAHIELHRAHVVLHKSHVELTKAHIALHKSHVELTTALHDTEKAKLQAQKDHIALHKGLGDEARAHHERATTHFEVMRKHHDLAIATAEVHKAHLAETRDLHTLMIAHHETTKAIKDQSIAHNLNLKGVHDQIAAHIVLHTAHLQETKAHHDTTKAVRDQIIAHHQTSSAHLDETKAQHDTIRALHAETISHHATTTALKLAHDAHLLATQTIAWIHAAHTPGIHAQVTAHTDHLNTIKSHVGTANDHQLTTHGHLKDIKWFIAQVAGWPAGANHAGGLSNVPYDNYRAVLHAGEQVLTAAQAAAYRSPTTYVSNKATMSTGGTVVKSGPDEGIKLLQQIASSLENQRQPAISILNKATGAKLETSVAKSPTPRNR